MEFRYNLTKSKLELDKKTLQLLEQVDAFVYSALPGFNTLGELHNTLSLEITDNIEDRKYTERMSIGDIKARIKELEKEKSASEKRYDELRERFFQTKDSNLPNQLERQMKEFQGYSELEKLKNILLQNEGNLDDYVVEIPVTVRLSGYYTRSGKNAKIVLKHNYGAKLISTYIHEIMHAFYDSKRLGDTPNSIEYVEEPLAEYGMLHFVKTFVQAHPEHKSLLDDAISMVSEKQYSFGLYHYAFGEVLYQKYSNIDWEKMLLFAKNKVDCNSEEYQSLQKIFSSRSKKNDSKTAQLIYDILNANGEPSKKITELSTPLTIDKDTYTQWLERYQKEGVLPSEEEMEKAVK